MHYPEVQLCLYLPLANISGDDKYSGAGG